MFLGNLKPTKKNKKRAILAKFLRRKRIKEALRRKKRGQVSVSGLNPLDKNKKTLIFSRPILTDHSASVYKGAYKQKYTGGLTQWYVNEPEMEGFHLKGVNKKGRKGRVAKRNSNGFLS